MRVRSAFVVVLLGIGLLPAAAQADVQISQRSYDENGNPYAIANVLYVSDPVGPAWRNCTTTCGDILVTDHALKPGPTDFGTIFQAESTVGGVTTTAQTPPWQGQLTNTLPPAVVGDLHIGKQVSAQRGRWSGGWGDDVHDLKLYACPDATTTSCVGLQIGYPSTTSSAYIHPAYAGWYLRAVDMDQGFNPAYAGVGLFFTPGLTATAPLQAASATVAISAPLGPIPPAAASVPRAVTGKLAVGSTITTASGTWPDAPPGSAIATGLRACPTRTDSSKCVALTGFGLPAATAKAKLTDLRLGWYVGSVDEHLWPNGTGLSPSTAETKLPAAGPTVIYGPLSKTPIGLGFTPRATLQRRATVKGGSLVLGELRCSGRCVATVTIRRGKSTVKATLPVTHKQRVLSIKASKLGGSKTASISVRATFAGSTTKAAATVLAPRSTN